MYAESAGVYDALCRHKDYRAASQALRELLQRVLPSASSLLDVGCGTGQHLSHLRDSFEVEGVDASEAMLEIARRRCPDIPLHLGSFLDFRLSRSFDIVTCLFGSIAYAVHPIHLQQAVLCMSAHLNPGGVLVVEPWVDPERFVEGKLVFDRVDEPDLKVARVYVTRRTGNTCVLKSEYVVATPQGARHFSEQQELGLFSDEEYRKSFADAGLTVVEASGDLFGYGLYVCRASSRRASNG